ncbi:MAG TPA: hypothetical protein VEY89_06080, partial [Candidatus Dormibacteraeota bacterium]|nr:hypothetical protein [Candidatus Dormibacteraeota bacterium]
YLALGMWDEVVAANEAAVRVAERERRARGGTGAPMGCGHGLTWLAYGYLQQGRFAAARRLVQACGSEMRERPMRASGADLLDADSTSAAAFSAMRSRYLIDSGDWSGPVAHHAVDTAGVVLAEFTRDFSDAYGATLAGQLETARAALARLRDSSARLASAAAAVGLPAESPERRVPGIELEELEGLLRLRAGDAVGGMAQLAAAAAAEKAIPMEFGPPSLDKPANELLGEMLLERGRPAEARTAFEAAQVLAPGRGQSLIGLARCAALLHAPELARNVEARLAKVHLREALAGGASR